MTPAAILREARTATPAMGDWLRLVQNSNRSRTLSHSLFFGRSSVASSFMLSLSRRM